MQKHYFVYILYSNEYNKYYVGFTSNPYKRLEEHNTGTFNTFTSNYRPWIQVAVFDCGNNKNDALDLERFIKKQKNTRFIKNLIRSDFKPHGILSQLIRMRVV
jgi:putative endonuclease